VVALAAQAVQSRPYPPFYSIDMYRFMKEQRFNAGIAILTMMITNGFSLNWTQSVYRKKDRNQDAEIIVAAQQKRKRRLERNRFNASQMGLI
jgi:hypothetical protein